MMFKWLLVLALVMTYGAVINVAEEDSDPSDSAGLENVETGTEPETETETEPEPVAPVAPVAPVRPVAPVAPVAPVRPVAPLTPLSSLRPLRPVVAPIVPGSSLVPIVHSTNPVTLKIRFIHEALRAHNRLRSLHGVPQLIHNPELSILAQKHARYLANHNTVVNSNALYRGERVGENIMFLNDISLIRYPGGHVTQRWYAQGAGYDYSRDHQPGTGLFTQMIWKDSREVGFGVRKTNDGRYYYVAVYWPAGNVLGQFGNNVFPPVH